MWTFDENRDFQTSFSSKKSGFVKAEFKKLKKPSEVYNFIAKSAWDVQKWLAAEAIFRSPR